MEDYLRSVVYFTSFKIMCLFMRINRLLINFLMIFVCRVMRSERSRRAAEISRSFEKSIDNVYVIEILRTTFYVRFRNNTMIVIRYDNTQNI